jgi:hypothetical protein
MGHSRERQIVKTRDAYIAGIVGHQANSRRANGRERTMAGLKV